MRTAFARHVPRRWSGHRLLRWLGIPVALVATTLLTAPAAHAEIRETRTINFQDDGAYAIVHYGEDAEGHYLQFYLHDTLDDGLCAVARADFRVDQGPTGHHHIDPGQVTLCEDGAQAWSERWYPEPNNDGEEDGSDTWEIVGIRWADACREELDGTRACRWGDGEPDVSVHNIPLLP
ncbi:hypothetical protein [Streptomyces marincola]|uniref:hypothetical protein n=1 Tax=Streptomyces marincola TaxID=2878388 RepID=UPI001CF108D0|nr:hypothetical protein [Streptomyces marincola]UCM88421.1 hypothetical protein LC193_10915 [Streptomyces marincola]